MQKGTIQGNYAGLLATTLIDVNFMESFDRLICYQILVQQYTCKCIQFNTGEQKAMREDRQLLLLSVEEDRTALQEN